MSSSKKTELGLNLWQDDDHFNFGDLNNDNEKINALVEDKADKATTYTKTEMDTTLKSKEPLISTKNTAFNKNFGDALGTVCEGNDRRLSDYRKASDVAPWAKSPRRPSYTAKDVGALDLTGGALTGTLTIIGEKAATEKYVNDKIIAAKEYIVIINVESNTRASLTGCNIIVNGRKYPITGVSDSITIAGVPGTVLNISFDDKTDYFKPEPIRYTITADVLTKIFNAQYVKDTAYIDVTLSSSIGESIWGRRITVGGESKIAQSTTTRFTLKSNTSYTISVDEWAGITKPDNKTVVTGGVGTVINVDMPYKRYFTFGVVIDETNSNPLTCVTYTDDAVGMTKGSNEWDNKAIFNKVRPCVVSNPGATVKYYLDPNNYAKKIDGTDADIVSGNDGDVMINLKGKFAYMIYRDGTNLIVKITDNPNAKSIDPRFSYNAFSLDAEGDASEIYIGAYKAFELNGKMRSLSGKMPTANQTIGANINKCAANGAGYLLFPFYQLTMLQCLYLIKYGNLNSQQALGYGYANNNPGPIATGGTNAKGLYFGETTGKQQMKFLGIEDFWGNLYCCVGGLYCDNSRNILTAYNNFNDTGSGYKNVGNGGSSDIAGYMSKPQGGANTGFIVKEVSGSSNAYYPDYTGLNVGCLPIYGGCFKAGGAVGAFILNIGRNKASATADTGARLCLVKK